MGNGLMTTHFLVIKKSKRSQARTYNINLVDCFNETKMISYLTCDSVENALFRKRIGSVNMGRENSTVREWTLKGHEPCYEEVD